jgi:hypothetical protein
MGGGKESYMLSWKLRQKRLDRNVMLLRKSYMSDGILHIANERVAAFQEAMSAEEKVVQEDFMCTCS